MNSSETKQTDVAIIGGGLAGLSLALQLRKSLPESRITVLERNRFPAPEAAFKVGESTVELATHYFADVLELKPHLDTEQLPKLGLRFFFGAEKNERIENRLEVGAREFPPTASYQLDRGKFENFLMERCTKNNICVVDDARVRSVELGSDQHTVLFSNGTQSDMLQSRWVVDASGRAGILKRQLGLKKESPHKANAVWFRIDKEISIQDWASSSDWQEFTASSRWYSTNHLMGAGYWVWLIPLSSGATSVGIVADDAIHPLASFNSSEKAKCWLARHEPQCAAKLEETGGTWLDFKALKHYSHDCQQVFSAKRWCLTGEAGVFLDPFYSPGSDFIAMSNTFITELIRSDVAGKAIGTQATFYNDLYLSFFRNTSLIFENQYKLFGHPQIMPLKIVWDFATYWTFMAFLFFQDALCDLQGFLRIRKELDRIGAVNAYLQQFFLTWFDVQPASAGASGRLDLFSIPHLRRLNEQLQERVSGDALPARLTENVDHLEELAAEIIAFAVAQQPVLQAELGSAEGTLAQRFHAANTDDSRHLKQFLGGLGL